MSHTTTFTFGTTPRDIAKEYYWQNDGFSYSLQGEDSRNADKLGLHNYSEETFDGFWCILERLADVAQGDESISEWAFGMRTAMLGCIGIEEI